MDSNKLKYKIISLIAKYKKDFINVDEHINEDVIKRSDEAYLNVEHVLKNILLEQEVNTDFFKRCIRSAKN